MAAHCGSGCFRSSVSAAAPPRSHPHPEQGKIIAACMFSAFAVMIILTLWYFRRLWRQENQQDGRVSNIDEVTSTPAAPTACKSEVLVSLPVFVYSSAVAEEKGKLECAVCLTKFREGEKGRVLPGCGHCFHAECIDLWLDSHCTCPLCRVTVESQSESVESEPLESAV